MEIESWECGMRNVGIGMFESRNWGVKIRKDLGNFFESKRLF